MISFGMPGGWEWIVLLVVVLVIFGNRIPGMARSLGSGITEFKRGLKEGQDKTPGTGTGTGTGSGPGSEQDKPKT